MYQINVICCTCGHLIGEFEEDSLYGFEENNPDVCDRCNRSEMEQDQAQFYQAKGFE